MRNILNDNTREDISTIGGMINATEILQYAADNGIIDMQCLQQQIEMDKRKKILLAHPYELVFNEKKGRWYTRFKVDGKVIQRNRKTREQLEELVVGFYENGGVFETRSEIEMYTFAQAHDRWLEVQREYGKEPNSIYRYEYDWKRYFAGTDFSDKDITLITSRDIETFVIHQIKKLNLKRQAGVTLLGYISGVFYTAVIDRIIPKNDNPCDYVDKKRFDKFYNKKRKPQEQRILSQEEILRLINKLNSDVQRDPKCLMPYGVRLALLTGMRTGEICGLRWSSVTDDAIIIRESEKYNQLTGEYYMSETKTGKERTLPMTEELSHFLDDMRQLQKEYGKTDDYVISTEGGKLRTKSLSDYMVRISHKLDFSVSKNIHTIRRTFNSYMRQTGTTAIMAGSIIGNSADVNNNHYTYDIYDLDTKLKLVSEIEDKMLAAGSFG